jgi:hypothetical protein
MNGNCPRRRADRLTVKDGIQPMVYGPFTTEEERDAEARRLHAAQDADTDAVFFAEVAADGELRVDSAAASFFEGERI